MLSAARGPQDAQRRGHDATLVDAGAAQAMANDEGAEKTTSTTPTAERLESERVERAIRDLGDDVFRTGNTVTELDLLRAAARHDLSIHETAELESRADAEGLLASDAEVAGLTDASEEMARGRVSVGASVDLVAAFMADVGRYEMLSASEEVKLARAVGRGAEASEAIERLDGMRDEALQEKFERLVAFGKLARDRMACSNLRLVVHIANHYKDSGKVELLDCIQDGVLGLLRAIERYDPELGFRFSTYASYWIRQAVQRGVASHGSTIRLPVHVHQKKRKLEKEARRLERRLGREPTPREIGDHVGLEAEEAAYYLELDRQTLSLDSPVGEGDDESVLGDFVSDDRGSVESRVELRMLGEELEAAMDQLDDRMRAVLIDRFGLDGRQRTLQSIGDDLGVTRQRVRQIEVRALRELSYQQALSAWLDVAEEPDEWNE